MKGSIRVVSKRKGGICALESETIIDVDRTSPILGNFAEELQDHKDPIKRARVVATHSKVVEKDFKARGPIRKALLTIARRVYAGEKIALRCWCAPLCCHADCYVEWINKWLKYWKKRDAAN